MKKEIELIKCNSFSVNADAEFIASDEKYKKISEQNTIIKSKRYSTEKEIITSDRLLIVTLKRLPSFEVKKCIYNRELKRILKLEGIMHCEKIGFRKMLEVKH